MAHRPFPLSAIIVLLFALSLGAASLWYRDMRDAPGAVGTLATSSGDRPAVWGRLVSLGVGDAVVRAEVVIDPVDRRRGLSGRTSLAADTGMLFVFPDIDTYGIWMPNMHFAIDILWLDDGLRVVDLQEGATPESYPRVFTPRTPARYVLEVREGFVRDRGVQVGDVVTVLNDAP